LVQARLSSEGATQHIDDLVLSLGLPWIRGASLMRDARWLQPSQSVCRQYQRTGASWGL